MHTRVVRARPDGAAPCSLLDAPVRPHAAADVAGGAGTRAAGKADALAARGERVAAAIVAAARALVVTAHSVALVT